MAKLSKKDIKKLPESLKVKLLKFGFERLDKAVSNAPYFHEDHPDECALWHDIMKELEE